MELGYACINMNLSKSRIMTNRTMRRKTFDSKGLSYVSDLSLQNVKDLKTIVKWNNEFGIKLFRLSSQIFPWMEEYDFTELKDYSEIKELMLEVGEIATQKKQRLTMHPGPYHCLASPTEKVVQRTIKGLNKHSEQFDLMGFKPSNYNKVNIHVGGFYGDKEGTLERFCKNFELLDENTKKRLVIENDDSANEYSVKDLYEGVYKSVGIPITFDYFHHKFNTGGLSEEEALKLASKTWPEGITQCCHYSESRRKEHLDEKIKPTAHSDLIYDRINTYGLEPDIVVEAKHKELAIVNYSK